MALQMYHSQLINRLAPCCWKFPALVRNYRRHVERGGLDPELETPYFSMRNRGAPKGVSVDILALFHRKDIWAAIKDRYKVKKEQEMREDQRFVPERQKVLGPDLSVTYFIICRGGKVKFTHNKDTWMGVEDLANKKIIPRRYHPNMHLEAVDASETKLCYEGFDNFMYLLHLKELLLRNCPYIDDWCLNRTSMFESSLEHLDISGCHNVTERGLCTLHNLKNLKTLTINDTPSIRSKELACLLLQEVLPKCKIVGVDYENPSLHDRLKEYLN